MFACLLAYNSHIKNGTKSCFTCKRTGCVSPPHINTSLWSHFYLNGITLAGDLYSFCNIVQSRFMADITRLSRYKGRCQVICLSLGKAILRDLPRNLDLKLTWLEFELFESQNFELSHTPNYY